MCIRDSTKNISIDAPINLQSDIAITSDYNGFSISCHEKSDGAISIAPINGIAPYTYLWTNQEKSSTLTNLRADTYEVTVTDAIGCETTNAITLNEPPALEADLMAFPIQCFGEGNGAISVAIVGPTAPYQFAINDGQFVENLSLIHI